MPQSYVIFVQNLPQFEMREASLDLSIRYTVADSTFDVEGELSEYKDELASFYIDRAHELVRTVVDMYSFATGTGLTCFTDTFISPDGVIRPILPERAFLRELCTAVDISRVSDKQDLIRTLLVLTADSQIFMALNDLIVAISVPRIADINCGRAIEAIRHVMTPDGVDRSLGWAIMRNRLNLGKKYVSVITDSSQAGRHGDRTEPGAVPINEILKRSWIIMNRFLEYKKGADNPLPVQNYPLLEE